MELITEAFASPLWEARFDRDAMIVRNAVLLGPSSLNHRDYPVSTMESAAHKFEGVKAFLNHEMDVSKPRRVQDLIGQWKNVHVENGKLRGNLHLIDNALTRGTILPIIESQHHLIRGSVVVSSKQRKAENGRQVIEEILAVRSCDLVAEPGTTRGIYESQEFTKETTTMNVTIDDLYNSFVGNYSHEPLTE